MSGPLEGIRVLDMGAFAVGPQSCGLLGVLGAEVIRIEPDYGDGLMTNMPYIKGIGTTYLAAHHNSKNIVLGLKDNQKDIEIAHKLLERVDILVENRRVGAMDRLGFGYEAVSRINPRIIYVSSAAYGQEGPFLKYGGADHLIQAMSGFASLNGLPGAAPQWVRYVALVDGTGSAAILEACLVGLLHRDRTGRGQHIRTDEFSASLFMQSSRIAEYLATGQEPPLMGSESPRVCPSRAFLTQDGKYLIISAATDGHWAGLCAAIGVKDTAAEPRFAGNQARLRHRAEVNSLIQDKIAEKPLVWWQCQLGRYHVPHSRIMGVEDLVQDAYIRSNGYIRSLTSKTWGALEYPVAPWRFKKTALNEPEASPSPDADRAYVLRLVRKAARPGAGAAPDGATRPLEGVRVVDLTQGISGPLCTAQLGSLGAEIIKVEHTAGDIARNWGPASGGESALFLQLNHDKKSFAVKYNEAEGLDVLRKLIRSADVLVEDLGDRETKRLGIGYTRVSRLKPGLIYASIRYALGDSEPDRPATELELQGTSGLMRWTGEPGGEPVKIGADAFSSLVGMFHFSAIMAALHNRRTRGPGERIVTSTLAAAIYMAAHGIMPMSGVDDWDGFWGSGPYDSAQYGYRTKNKPVMVSLKTRNEQQGRATYEAFCKGVGLGKLLEDPYYAEKTFRTMSMGTAAQKAKPVYEAALANWDAEELVKFIDACGGLAAPLLTYRDLFNPVHEQVRQNNMMVEQTHPRAGLIKLINNPWRDGGQAEIKTPAPALGEHTGPVMAALGYSESKIRKLAERGIVRN
ncbi:MAG: CoA transferase [Chloroflexi bacterium]|nr:CoA transferase [Chloroflexota bacterium]